MAAPEIIKKVRRIELVTRRLVNPQLTGAYHSVFKGRGMDFDEVTPYAAGDDPRFIDWNVAARTGELHVKRFVEERELTVQIMVDVSASMQFGTAEETKRTIAAQLAAVFAVLAIRNNDRVGLAMFDHEVDRYTPPKKGRKHIMRLITQILDHEPRNGQTDLVAAMRYVARVTRRRSIILVVSDFLSEGWETELTLLSRRHDVIPIIIEDLRERSLDVSEPVSGDAGDSSEKQPGPHWLRRLFGGGVIALRDLESGQTTFIDPDAEAVRTWEGVEAERRVLRDQSFTRLGVDALRFDTSQTSDKDFVRPIAAFFKRRTRRQ
jgi:uncharacterized protein (DUF58 family)